jgi:hypothetical protein
MYYPDFSTACQVGQGERVRAIGWLNPAHPYTQGPVTDTFLQRLQQHVASAWEPVVAGGPHFCEFCPPHAVGESRNLWIPTPELLFIAPAMILHYINAHTYQPPVAFIEAVFVCPQQGSAAFHELLQPFLADDAGL